MWSFFLAFLLVACSIDMVEPYRHHSRGVNNLDESVLLNKLHRRSTTAIHANEEYAIHSNEEYSLLPNPPPERNDDEPVIVKIFAEPVYLFDIQQINCVVHLSLLLEMSWYDHDMAFTPSPDLLAKSNKRHNRTDTISLKEQVGLTESDPSGNILEDEEYDPKKHEEAEAAYASGEDIGDPVHIDSNANWSPGMVVVNQIEPLAPIETEKMVRYPSGMVEFSRLINVKANIDLDYHHFPFDIHSLNIRLSAFGYDAEQIMLITDKSKRSTNFDIHKLDIPDFMAIGWYCEDEILHTAFEEHDSMLSCYMTIQRNNANVLTIIVFPEILIVLFSLSAFFIRGDKIDIRVGITSTAMLTMMAFLFSVSNQLPAISYLTWLHYYSFMCFIFVFNVMGSVVWLNHMDPDGHAFRKGMDGEADFEAEYYRTHTELDCSAEHDDGNLSGDDLEKSILEEPPILPQKEKFPMTGGYDLMKIDRRFRVYMPLYFMVATVFALALEIYQSSVRTRGVISS